MPLHSNVPRYARTRRNLKQLGTRQHLSHNKQSIEESTKDLCVSLDTQENIPENISENIPEDTPKDIPKDISKKGVATINIWRSIMAPAQMLI